MDISIILNSRGRTSLLIQFLFRLNCLANHFKPFEVLVGCDNDDPPTKLFEDTLNHFPHTRTIFQDRTPNLHSRFNHMAHISQGKYIFLLNDDAFLSTPNWNITIVDTLNKYLEDKPDSIVMGMPFDNSCDKVGEYASFMILSRPAVETLGFFMLEDWQGCLGGDVIMHRIFDSVHRTTPIDVHIDHVFHSTVERVIHPDSTALEMRALSQKSNGQIVTDCFSLDISQYTEKLQSKIK